MKNKYCKFKDMWERCDFLLHSVDVNVNVNVDVGVDVEVEEWLTMQLVIRRHMRV